MRALVMAAGLGTRLRPLTNNIPKPLLPIGGRPMVENVLDNLARAGITEAIINVHYLPKQLLDFVDSWNKRGGLPQLCVQDETAEILGSGGAVALAAPWLFEHDSAALVCNCEPFTRPDLNALVRQHERLAGASGVECTLAVMKHSEAGAFYNGLRRNGDLIVAFEQSGSADSALWHFPGYYVIEKSAVRRFPNAGTPFSVREALWIPLAQERKLGAWEYVGIHLDLENEDDLRRAELALAKIPPP